MMPDAKFLAPRRLLRYMQQAAAIYITAAGRRRPPEHDTFIFDDIFLDTLHYHSPSAIRQMPDGPATLEIRHDSTPAREKQMPPAIAVTTRREQPATAGYYIDIS